MNILPNEDGRAERSCDENRFLPVGPSHVGYNEHVWLMETTSTHLLGWTPAMLANDRLMDASMVETLFKRARIKSAPACLASDGEAARKA